MNSCQLLNNARSVQLVNTFLQIDSFEPGLSEPCKKERMPSVCSGVSARILQLFIVSHTLAIRDVMDHSRTR
jgi:hypothetical protein